jgi:ribosomal protein S2
VEKRSAGMGINNNNKLSSRQKQASDFLFLQACWGHKKQYLKHSLNKHILGLKNDFVIFNSEHFLEYSNRCSFFCFNTINTGGTILFISSDDNYKKLTLFYTLRSFQRFYVNKWFGGLVTNNLLGDKIPDVFIVSNLKYDTYVLKEASSKLIPVLCLEDSDHPLHKSFYSAFANDDKKDSIYLFYNLLTDSIIKSLLVVYSSNLYK